MLITMQTFKDLCPELIFLFKDRSRHLLGLSLRKVIGGKCVFQHWLVLIEENQTLRQQLNQLALIMYRLTFGGSFIGRMFQCIRFKGLILAAWLLLVLSTPLADKVSPGHHKEIQVLTFQALAFCQSINLTIVKLPDICNSVDKTKNSFPLPHRRTTSFFGN